MGGFGDRRGTHRAGAGSQLGAAAPAAADRPAESGDGCGAGPDGAVHSPLAQAEAGAGPVAHEPPQPDLLHRRTLRDRPRGTRVRA